MLFDSSYSKKKRKKVKEKKNSREGWAIDIIDTIQQLFLVFQVYRRWHFVTSCVFLLFVLCFLCFFRGACLRIRVKGCHAANENEQGVSSSNLFGGGAVGGGVGGWGPSPYFFFVRHFDVVLNGCFLYGIWILWMAFRVEKKLFFVWRHTPFKNNVLHAVCIVRFTAQPDTNTWGVWCTVKSRGV